MLDGKDIIVLTKDEGRKLLLMIRMLARSNTVTTSKRALYSMHELGEYSDHDCLSLVQNLDRLTKEEVCSDHE